MEKTIHSSQNRLLTKWLKQKRNEQNLTMRDLAGRLDVQHTFVSKIEQGERRLDLIEFIRYCKALDADPEEGIRFIKDN